MGREPRGFPDRSVRVRLLVAWLLVLAGLLPLALVLCLVVGLGALRDLSGPVQGATAVFLVALPVVGLAQGRVEGLALSVWVWCVGLWLGAPLYVPGERGEAVRAGSHALFAPFGDELRVGLAEWVERVLEVVDGEIQPAREVEGGLPEPAPRVLVLDAPTADMADAAALPYEGSGSSLRVRVTLEGRRGAQREVDMTWDTGATFTTLPEAVVDALGVAVEDDGPVVSLLTANGEVEARLALLDEVWLAGFPVRGVTVALCESCALGDSVGLLGLDVSGQFLSTVDPGRKEILLQPREQPDRVTSLRPWVEVSGEVRESALGQRSAVVTAENRSRLPMAGLEAEVTCRGEARERTFRVRLGAVGPGRTVDATVALPGDAACLESVLALAAGTWGER